MPRDFQKVNSEQIFLMWRNFATSALALVLLHVFTMVLPPLFAPVISTCVAGFLYYQIFSNSYSKNEICIIVPYTFFFVTLVYTIVLISLNVLEVWGVLNVPSEILFFDAPYLQSLLLAPVGLLVCSVMYMRRHRLAICVSCRLTNGTPLARGRVGIIYSNESSLQLKNLILLYSVITTIVWGYYILEFIDVTISSRDNFIFTGVSVFMYLLDILYFGIRYYNLYLDLKERDELVSPSELNEIGTRTYVRFYVICGDSIYLSAHSMDGLRDDDSDIIDTPFTIKRTVSGIQEYEIKGFIERQTGCTDGELRFFYGRKRADAAGRRVLRYFYFIPDDKDEYDKLPVEGEWISSDKIKTIYHNAPDRLASVFLSDISRIALILVTRKTFDENGERRTKLTHYRPSFTLQEIRDSDVDFQDDKWIRVSMFNADTSLFRLKRWWRRHISRAYME